MLTLIRACWRILTVLLLAGLFMAAPASAATQPGSKTTTGKTTAGSSSSSDSAQSSQVTQGYGSNQPLQIGMVVKLVDKDPTKVEPATLSTITKMMGIVVQPNDTAFALGNNGNNGQVFVANSGRYQVLVSNQNGPIKVGDYVTISALAGVATKADSSQSPVLGRAAGTFDGTANVIASATLNDTTGKQVKVSIGRIIVQVGIGANPNKDTGAKYVPAPLRTMADLVSGKPTSAIKIYIGLLVLIITSIICGVMLFSGIRSGIIAIGRNPMAKKHIVAGMVRVVLMTIILFVVGLFGVYLMIKI